MIIDLSHSLHNNISVYPGTRPPKFMEGNTIQKDGFAELDIEITTHSGTHMDAPCHILKGAKSLDQFCIEKFIGPAYIIDCRKQKLITLKMIKDQCPDLSEFDFLLFYTGWAEKWMTDAYLKSYPVLDESAAQYIVESLLKGVGFDCISPDGIESHHLPNHHLFLQNEVLIIENLCNLHLLIGKSFVFNAIPVKIKNADGSPIRAFAKVQS